MERSSIIHLYLDANIWLSLYHYSNDDLEQFEKLKTHAGKEVKLYIPHQTFDEVNRNRDSKLKDSFSTFEQFCFRFPVFCKNYEEYDEFVKSYNALKKQHGIWCNKVKEDIENETLSADRVLSIFFDTENIIPITEDMTHRAEIRYRCGNPPGKDNRFGDAINWECLLDSVPNGEDLYFVSSDKDYYSPFNKEKFNSFLCEEWHKKKKAKIHFYKTLVDFLKDNIESIRLSNESYKIQLIHDLGESRSFLTTHHIIAELSQYSDWSTDQIHDLLAAAINNEQVRWIIRDSDIAAFYNDIIRLDLISDEAQTVNEMINNEA